MDLGHGRIEARLGKVGHPWSVAETVSRDGEAPITAVGAGGTAAVAWSTLSRDKRHEDRTSIYVSIATPGHQFNKARLLASGTRLSDPEGLEVLTEGEVVVVWSRQLPAEGGDSTQRKDVDYALLAAATSRPSTGVIEVGGFGPLSVAETEAGAVLIAYPTAVVTQPSPVNQQAAVATLPPPGGTTFSQSQTVDAEPDNPYAEIHRAAIAAGPGGAALAFADKVDALQPSGLFGNPLPVGESPQEAAERETTARESAEPKPSTGPISTEDLAVALPADGAQVAVWQRTRALTPVSGVAWRRVIVATRATGASVFATPVRLSPNAGLSGTPKIATAGGTTLVLWTQNTLPCKQRVFAAIRPASGAFSSATAISPVYRPLQSECYFGAGQLALAGSSRYAIAGWVQNRALHVMTLTGQ
jgi:hypothetical protein